MIPPRQRQGRPGHERWLISYADFVTLLFALFLVLFASAYRDKRSVTKVSSAVHQGFRQMQIVADAPPPNVAAQLTDPLSATQSLPQQTEETLATTLASEAAKDHMDMRLTPEGIIISLHELGFFSSGDDHLLPGSEERLQGLSSVLMQHHLRVRVEGHTDRAPMHNGRFASNWELSTARATAVARVLLDKGGFDPQRISIAGYGEFHPAASNDTPEGRRMNRRVDIVVVPQNAAADTEAVTRSSSAVARH